MCANRYDFPNCTLHSSKDMYDKKKSPFPSVTFLVLYMCRSIYSHLFPTTHTHILCINATHPDLPCSITSFFSGDFLFPKKPKVNNLPRWLVGWSRASPRLLCNQAMAREKREKKHHPPPGPRKSEQLTNSSTFGLYYVCTTWYDIWPSCLPSKCGTPWRKTKKKREKERLTNDKKKNLPVKV